MADMAYVERPSATIKFIYIFFLIFDHYHVLLYYIIYILL